MKAVFESEGIVYVEVTEFLLQDYMKMVNDIENVGRLMGRCEPLSEEKERSWIHKKLAEKAPVFSMIEKRSGSFIGNIELMHVQRDEGELGIAITAEKQNMGFGTEAVQAMCGYCMDRCGLNRIFLKVFPWNTRAVHVYQKAGFREYERSEKDIFMEIRS